MKTMLIALALAMVAGGASAGPSIASQAAALAVATQYSGPYPTAAERTPAEIPGLLARYRAAPVICPRHRARCVTRGQWEVALNRHGMCRNGEAWKPCGD